MPASNLKALELIYKLLILLMVLLVVGGLIFASFVENRTVMSEKTVVEKLSSIQEEISTSNELLEEILEALNWWKGDS